MDKNLPLAYLLLLVGLLAGAIVFVIRQIIKTRRIETTLFDLQNKLSKEPGTAQEYYELGSIYNDKKLYSQAVTVLQKALKAGEDEDPQNLAMIYNALGYAHLAKEQYDIAIRQYKEALKLTPIYPTASNNLGYAYEKKKLIAQALEAYEETLKNDPDNQTAKYRAESLRKRIGIPSESAK